jgi:hypothetical protein
LPTSFRRFVGNLFEEHSPPAITYRPGEHPRRESFDVQIFDGDQSVVIDQPTADLVVKVGALTPDVRVRLSQKQDGLPAAAGAFFSASYFALCASQPRPRFSVVARVLYFRAVARSSE